MVVIFLLAVILAMTVGFLLALWAVESGYLATQSVARSRQLQEQLRLLDAVHSLSTQAWQTQQALQAHGAPPHSWTERGDV